ncbi:MAG: PGPGW domain-containing protein [Acidimicrobiia bacterium]
MERAARIAGGFALLGAGTAMLVLPGPGILAILGGLALLEKDMPWAKRITDRVRPKAKSD